MNLLDKFQSVEIKSDTRITDSDKKFCEAQQAAYNAAKTALPELSYFWEDICNTQRTLLADTDTSKLTYLQTISDGFSEYKIDTQRMNLHSVLIHQIVHYFNKCYHISVCCEDIEENLIPQIPDGYRHFNDKKQQIQYQDEMLNLTLNYTDIINQLFIQLDGRDFDGQALHELKNKCHGAAWGEHTRTAYFERKKDTIRFSYSCSQPSWTSRDTWELTERMKKILTGIAHFETESFSIIPSGFDELLGYNRFSETLHTFTGCRKIKQLRLFKNGRGDFKFNTETYATQFVNDYLGAVC